jgi:hypothetical protein
VCTVPLCSWLLQALVQLPKLSSVRINGCPQLAHAAKSGQLQHLLDTCKELRNVTLLLADSAAQKDGILQLRSTFVY